MAISHRRNQAPWCGALSGLARGCEVRSRQTEAADVAVPALLTAQLLLNTVAACMAVGFKHGCLSLILVTPLKK